ncbi:MAG: hypothetical protein E7535_01260 [Ruminococcaceae bacterium]|nr:hypothetical protein [Oscillospiraceae bacterium]
MTGLRIISAELKNMYFLGIDGGGTKTTCLVSDENLNIIFRSVGSSINFYSEGLEGARKNMKDILLGIEKNTGISRFDAVCIGSSALFARADEKTRASFCDGIFDCGNIIMDSDLFIALKAAERKNCAVVISGTGSMTAAADKDGNIITKGGFGFILGDEGSGYRIALDGIREAVRSLDETGEKTVLGEALLGFSGASSKEELVDIFYSPEKSRKEIAAFAPYVISAAENGDSVALCVVSYQLKLLSETLRALSVSLGEKPFAALFGGVFQNSSFVRDKFSELIKDFTSGCEILKNEPVFGALIAAKELTENDN